MPSALALAGRSMLVTALLLLAPPLLADGEIDDNFGGNGTAFHALDLGNGNTDFAEDLVVQRDGRVIVVGSASDDDGEVTKLVVVRVDADGTLDTAFGSAGTFVLDFSSLGLALTRGGAAAVALDGAGRVLVAGTVRDGATDRPLLVRLTAAGALDATFFGDGILVGNAAGRAADIELGRTTGVVWAIGTTAAEQIWTWRWNPAGGGPVEREWSVPGSYSLRGDEILVQPDGKPLIAGSHALNGTWNLDLYVARLLADGSAMDPTYGLFSYGFDVAPDYDDDYLIDLALNPRGRLVVLAETEVGPGNFDSEADLGFLRLTAAGALDSTFGTGGARRLDVLGSGRDAWYVGGVAVQGDGKIVAGTTAGSSPFSVRASVVRLLPSGALDPTFGAAGTGKVTFDLEPNGGGGDERSGFHAIGLEAGRVFGAGPSEWLDPDWDLGFGRLNNHYIFRDGFEIGTGFFWSRVAH